MSRDKDLDVDRLRHRLRFALDVIDDCAELLPEPDPEYPYRSPETTLATRLYLARWRIATSLMYLGGTP